MTSNTISTIKNTPANFHNTVVVANRLFITIIAKTIDNKTFRPTINKLFL